jgi:uncharacterized protein YecE (DUF72 family)
MIRVGIGGWTFEPWRGTFFPDKLAQARELEYASRQVTSIEINGTYYRTQQASSFAKWAEETPDDFIFAVKALRFCTNRKVLAEAGESVGKFLDSGLTELGDKLGPILWQFMPTKKFDAEDFGAFLGLLPDEIGKRRLRHAVEVRHDSFRTPAFIELARKHNAAVVFADSDTYPNLPDVTADFVYARLENAQEAVETGYTDAELDRWTATAKAWEKGEQPDGFDYIHPDKPKAIKRDAFVYMINGAKVRAPAAAKAMIGRL